MIAPDRWGRIEELFRAVYDLPPEARRASLGTLEDPAIRADLEALLDTHETLQSGDDSFLGALDTDRARSLLERSGPKPTTPATIGPYRVVRTLARGGMGIVYLAHDPRLDRPVAIKLLPPYLSGDPAAKRGLAEEARTASALDHPRIATVYEIGETGEGGVFLAMAYYDGETLRERLRGGPMAPSEVIEIGIQLAEGIGAAHRAGVIHRDVKPENILITRDGSLKIVDFGVAKFLREGLTTAGPFPGTAAYMSPEQTRGEGLDGRADVWAAGVVLYEMLAGQRPFGGDGDALVHAIRHDPPRALATLRPGLPEELARGVERCLEKDRDLRLESGDALARELRAARTGGSRAAAAGRAGDRPGRGRLAAIVAASLAVLMLAGFLSRGGRNGRPADVAGEAIPAVAVLPFEVRGENLGLWREGMVDLLSIGLDGASGLRVVDARTVLARWRGATGADSPPDLERSLAVARDVGARYAVIGSVVSGAGGLRFGARVYSLPEGADVQSFQVEGPADSLFALVDRLAIDILAATWQGEEQSRRQVDLARITTSSPSALKAYLEGESLLRRADFAGAAAAYERAVAADSTFGFALTHLGLAYGWLSDAPRQDAAYLRALRHADRLPEREELLLRAIAATSVADPMTAVGLLREATHKYPDDPDAWYFLGDRHFHDGKQLLASREESERAFRRVVALDPGFAPAYVHLINNAFTYRPDSARAARLVERYHRLAPTSDVDEENRIAFGLAFGGPALRAAAFAALDTLPPDTRTILADQYLDHPRFWGTREAVLGRPAGARSPLHPWTYGLITASRVDNALAQGRSSAAIANLEDPSMFTGMREAVYYRIFSAGLPLSRAVADGVLAAPGAKNLGSGLESVMAWFYAGAYAADRGRWEDHASAVEGLAKEADRLLSEGDSAGARFTRGAATALDGKGRWARGDADGALPLLMAGQEQATWAASRGRETLNETIRWWVGDLLLEAGRPDEAVRYFEASWDEPLAAERLGPIYERLGDLARARAAYGLVVSGWKDADPELQPRVRAAELALRRLGGPAAQ